MTVKPVGDKGPAQVGGEAKEFPKLPDNLKETFKTEFSKNFGTMANNEAVTKEKLKAMTDALDKPVPKDIKRPGTFSIPAEIESSFNKALEKTFADLSAKHPQLDDKLKSYMKLQLEKSLKSKFGIYKMGTVSFDEESYDKFLKGIIWQCVKSIEARNRKELQRRKEIFNS